MLQAKWNNPPNKYIPEHNLTLQHFQNVLLILSFYVIITNLMMKWSTLTIPFFFIHILKNVCYCFSPRSWISNSHLGRIRAAKFRPMFGTYDSEGLPTMTRDFCLHGLIRRTTQLNLFLRQAKYTEDLSLSLKLLLKRSWDSTVSENSNSSPFTLTWNDVKSFLIIWYRPSLLFNNKHYDYYHSDKQLTRRPPFFKIEINSTFVSFLD